MTKTQPTHKKLPRAALFWLRETGGAFPLKSDKFPPDVPGAFIPCHTPAQAKQLVKAAEFLRLPEEEKIKFMEEHYDAASPSLCPSCPVGLRAVLRAMGAAR